MGKKKYKQHWEFKKKTLTSNTDSRKTRKHYLQSKPIKQKTQLK